MGRWVWQNDDGSIEVPPTDLANHLSQSVNGYKQQQQSSQAKVSQTGAYVQYPGTTQQNMAQLGQQLNPQQHQPVAYWNPNTNVVYAGGMPTQMPQVVPIGYGYSQGYGTAPLVYDMSQGQYVGGSMNQFGPTGNATVPMTTGNATVPMTTGNATVPMTTGNATVPMTTGTTSTQVITPTEQNSSSDQAQISAADTPSVSNVDEVKERDLADAANINSLIPQIADRFVPTKEEFDKIGQWAGITDYNKFLKAWKLMTTEEQGQFWDALDYR